MAAYTSIDEAQKAIIDLLYWFSTNDITCVPVEPNIPGGASDLFTLCLLNAYVDYLLDCQSVNNGTGGSRTCADCASTYNARRENCDVLYG